MLALVWFAHINGRCVASVVCVGGDPRPPGWYTHRDHDALSTSQTKHYKYHGGLGSHCGLPQRSFLSLLLLSIWQTQDGCRWWPHSSGQKIWPYMIEALLLQGKGRDSMWCIFEIKFFPLKTGYSLIIWLYLMLLRLNQLWSCITVRYHPHFTNLKEKECHIIPNSDTVDLNLFVHAEWQVLYSTPAKPDQICTHLFLKPASLLV